MIFIVLIFVFGLYLLISISAIYFSVRWARRSGKSPWLWGCIAAFVMYNLVFWDWIPTVLVHKYYCATEAEFTAYKTFGEWDKENPGVKNTLRRSHEPFKVKSYDDIQIYWLTQRFYKEIHREDGIMHVRTKEEKFYDAYNGELIAHYKNYYKGNGGNVISLGGSLNDIRLSLIFGWANRQCDINGDSPEDAFKKYIYQFWKWGKGK